MSKSLNINAPQIVQTRNTLNAVPSGSTAEPDYNVKFVPQTLTDAQKAQARQNIGAAAEGQGGGATVNEFHYKKDTSTTPATYYIDAPGYTPAEGDLMVVIFDEIMDPTNGCTIRNGSENITLDLRNAPVSEYNYYDDVYGTPNTRWTVKLEKDQSDNWHAYNISTIELPNWNTDDEHMPGYIKNKPSIPAAQVQADWNQTDNTAVDYIKNKPTIDTKYFGNVMDMYNTLTVFTTHGGKSVIPNNGNELGNVKDIIIGVDGPNGLTMYDTPKDNNGCGIYRTTWIIDPQKMRYNGYWRFYPDSEMKDLWMYLGINDDSQRGQIDNPIQEIWCKDVNIVLRGTTGAYNNYKRINRIKQNLQLVTKFTVWNTTNTGWQGLWDGTGDVVLFDTEMEKFVEAVNAPNSLIGFKIYMPKSRYTEFVTAMETAWGQSAVENYILPKVETYDFVYSEGFKYKMVNSIPLTMTDAGGNTISGDFVANNVTITPAV